MTNGVFRPNRRQVLGGLAAVSVARPGFAQSSRALTAAPGKAQLAPEGFGPTDVWAFDGSVPGPVLRGRQGERMRLTVQNDLPQQTSVHWHGLRLENAMDGVPGLTQEPIAPGAAFDYDFRLSDAGTYWYHSHERSFEQVARGLYGPLIIDETEAPDVDADEVLAIDDWRLVGEGAIADGFGALMDASHAGRIGNWVTVNGTPEWTKPLARGIRVRLRLINVANARVMALRLTGMSASIVALDGQPVGTPMPTDTLSLAPAQRVDLLADITADEGGEALILSRERDGDYAIASFLVEAGTSPRDEPIAALPPNDVPLPEFSSLESVPLRTLRMEGGAMGRMMSARLDGQELGPRELAAQGMVWAFNGVAGMPDEPFAEVARGETLRIALVNETGWPHGMHLHGHHFLERQGDNWSASAPLRDTTLVGPQAATEIAFVADNPGDWLLHCHMLEHAHSGMMTWIRVV